MDNEAWYDEEIAPRLMELSKLCQERDVPFTAIVEYAPEAIGQTSYYSPKMGLKMVMINLIVKNAPNVDGFFLGLSRYAQTAGVDLSGSVVFRSVFKAATSSNGGAL